MALTRPVVESLLRLNSPEFSAFRGWLDEQRQAARDRCETLEGVPLSRAQGFAGAYGELLNLIRQAPSLVDKVK